MVCQGLPISVLRRHSNKATELILFDHVVGCDVDSLGPVTIRTEFDDQPIAFLYVGCGLNVEVIDTDLRRGLLDEIAR